MAVALTGLQGDIINAIKGMLSESTSLQVWLGVDGEMDPIAAALALLGHFWLDAPAEGGSYGDGYPMVNIDTLNPIKQGMIAGGYGSTFNVTASVVITFIDLIPESIKDDLESASPTANIVQDAFATMSNNLSAVLSDLRDLSGTDNDAATNLHPEIIGIELHGPDQLDEEETPNTLGGMIILEVGFG